MDNTDQNARYDRREQPKMKQQKKRARRRTRLALLIGRHIVIVLFAAFIVVPLYVVFITSFKTTVEANDTVFHWWPEQGFSLDGYIRIFTTNQVNRDLIRAFGVTLWMYVPPIAVGVFVSAMAAYGFAKMDFFLKKPIFAILISALTLPNSVGMIAAIIMYNSLGWMGTPLPLMVPRLMGSIGIVFFLRQFFMGLPNDLNDAARVDRAGRLRHFSPDRAAAVQAGTRGAVHTRLHQRVQRLSRPTVLPDRQPRTVSVATVALLLADGIQPRLERPDGGRHGRYGAHVVPVSPFAEIHFERRGHHVRAERLTWFRQHTKRRKIHAIKKERYFYLSAATARPLHRNRRKRSYVIINTFIKLFTLSNKEEQE